MTLKKLALAVAAVAAGVSHAAVTETTVLPVSKYAQDGLVAQWDAIENVGAGLHDDAPTTWKDLCGTGVDFPMGDCTVGENSVVMPSANKAVEVNKSVWGSFRLGQPYTIEICWKFAGNYPTSPDYFTFQSDETYFYRQNETQFNIPHLYNLNGKHKKIWGRYAYSTAEIKEASTISFSCDGQSDKGCCLYRNGGDARAQNGQAWTQDIATPEAVTRLIRASGNRNFTLTYYAIRIYDHVLTDGEREQNYLIDRNRFFGEPIPADKRLIVSIPDQKFDGIHPVTPVPKVTDLLTDKVLESGVDYEYSCEGTDALGTGTCMVTGKGEYAGCGTVASFKVVSAYGYGTILFVSPYADDSADEDCSSWEKAGTLANACSRATAGTVIFLMSGTAEEPAIYDYSAVDITAATADTIAVCDNRADVTIRSQDLNPTNCIIRGGGTAQNKRLLYFYGANTKLQGISFEGFGKTGHSTDDPKLACGDGAVIFAAQNKSGSEANSVAVSNCIFRANYGEDIGACCYGTYQDCAFLCNTNINKCGAHAGGAAVVHAYWIRNGYFAGNKSAQGGAVGPMGRTKVYDSLFEDNEGYACVATTHASLPLASNCVFRSNSCPVIDGSSVANSNFQDCEIFGYAAVSGGSTIAAAGNLRHCWIHDNYGYLQNANCVDCEIWNMNGESTGSECFLGYSSSFTNCFVHDCSCGSKRAFSRCKYFEDCVFSNMTCQTFGATKQWGAVPPFRRCVFVDNTLVNIGDYTSPAIENNGAENCLFIRNTFGHILSGEGSLLNCTVVSNVFTAVKWQYARQYFRNKPTVDNCILVHNSNASGNPMMLQDCTVRNTVYDCDSTDSRIALATLTDCHQYTGADYPFKDTDELHPYIGVPKRGLGGYGLGLILSYTDESIDLAGLPRVVDGKVDAGCYQRVPGKPGLMLLIW